MLGELMCTMTRTRCVVLLSLTGLSEANGLAAAALAKLAAGGAHVRGEFVQGVFSPYGLLLVCAVQLYKVCVRGLVLAFFLKTMALR